MAFTLRSVNMLARRVGALRTLQSRSYADDMSFTFAAANQVTQIFRTVSLLYGLTNQIKQSFFKRSFTTV